MRERRHQHLLEVQHQLAREKRRHHVCERVRDDGHHDEPGRDERHVRHAVHVADPRADEAAENDEIQRHRNGWRHDGLDPDPHHAS
ncbi:hypothetical protein D3C83_126200 [compost metagenome]